MPTHISRSEKTNGRLIVYFGNAMTGNAYYAHSIREIGTPQYLPSRHLSAWGWINHMREKRWFSPSLEKDFLLEVTKRLHG